MSLTPLEVLQKQCIIAVAAKKTADAQYAIADDKRTKVIETIDAQITVLNEEKV